MQTPALQIIKVTHNGRMDGRLLYYLVGHLASIPGIKGNGPFGLVDLRKLPQPEPPPKQTALTTTPQSTIIWKTLPVWYTWDGCTHCIKGAFTYDHRHTDDEGLMSLKKCVGCGTLHRSPTRY